MSGVTASAAISRDDASPGLPSGVAAKITRPAGTVIEGLPSRGRPTHCAPCDAHSHPHRSSRERSSQNSLRSSVASLPAMLTHKRRPYDRHVTATLEAGPSLAEADVVHDESGPIDEPIPPRVRLPASLQPWHDPHPRVGWALTALIFAVACFTRLWAIGFPPGKQFDEV